MELLKSEIAAGQISFKEEPYPPACEEAEWRFLLFLKNAVMNGEPIQPETISVFSLDSGNYINDMIGIRKPRIYGQRTYLTLPVAEKEPMWFVAKGYMIEGVSSCNPNPQSHYLLRQVMSDPDIEVMKRISSTFSLPEAEIRRLEESVNRYGYMSVLQEYMAETVV